MQIYKLINAYGFTEHVNCSAQHTKQFKKQKQNFDMQFDYQSMDAHIKMRLRQETINNV